jgi:hypothetical protein
VLVETREGATAAAADVVGMRARGGTAAAGGTEDGVPAAPVLRLADEELIVFFKWRAERDTKRTGGGCEKGLR